MPKVDKVPDSVRPFLFHGLALDWEGREHAVADACPWCGREGKFTVAVETGVWGCFVCGEKGNVLTFLRKLWDESDKRTNGESTAFAAERGLLFPDTLTAWGVVKSVLDGGWLVPGHAPDGKLCQLYKRIKVGAKDGKPAWEMRPTPTLPHALVGLPLFDPKRSEVWLHESWGNALAFWEAARTAKRGGDGALTMTGSEASSVLADANVLAVANCGAAGEPLKRYLPLFAGKKVRLAFDSDHPREHNGAWQDGAGLAATKRVAKLLVGSNAPPSEVSWLRWGEEGHDPLNRSGWDVRDALSGGHKDRVAALGELLALVEPVPAEWFGDAKAPAEARIGVSAEECRDWKTMLDAWRNALVMTPSVEVVLSVALAVCLSTKQSGDQQLYLQIIGEAGSAKTRLCQGLLTSKSCYALMHFTGFHSGWRAGEDDYSLLARINNLTWVTPEADVLMASPKFNELMSQTRQAFDGSSASDYKTSKTQQRQDGLRAPWVMAGTMALLNTNQAHLGDRFMRVFIDPPGQDKRRDIMRQIYHTSRRTVAVSSNCDAGSIVEPNMRKAYQLTGGYVDFLRANAEELIQVVEDSEEAAERIMNLAEFAADLRARPDPVVNKQEKHDAKETPNRLVYQFTRLATCLAAVLGKRSIDEDVLLRVRKVALDTARGKTLDIARVLAARGWDEPDGGEEARVISGLVAESPDRTTTLLRFLRKIGVVEWFNRKGGGMGTQTRWRLTPRAAQLCKEVL